MLVSPATCVRTQLKSLGLSNNVLGDDLMTMICKEVLINFTSLESVDISANKLSDNGL